MIRIGETFGGPTFHIPFVVLFYYRLQSPPYNIHLDLTDKTRSLNQIVLESVSIEYEDGVKSVHELNWTKDFEYPKLLTYVPISVKRLETILPVMVKKRKSGNLVMNGYFINTKENKIPFNTNDHFEYEPKTWRIFPLSGSF